MSQMDKVYIMVEISSPHFREKLVAEVAIADKQFAEVNIEQAEPVITIFPRQTKEDWIFR